MVTATAQILPSGTEQPRREKGLEWPLVLTDPEALFRPLNWQAAFDYVNQALLARDCLANTEKTKNFFYLIFIF